MDQPEFPPEASAKSKWRREQWTSCAPKMGVAISIANHVFPLRITSKAREQELPPFACAKGAAVRQLQTHRALNAAMPCCSRKVRSPMDARRVVSLGFGPPGVNVIYATI
jgi:hypothetical protein